MFRFKITGYIFVSMLSRNVDHWILLITYQVEVIRRYGLNLVLA